MRKTGLLSFLLCLLLAVSCARKPHVDVEDFGTLSTGAEARLFTLVNSCGNSLSVTDYGARIVSLCVPDRRGLTDDVTVGFDNLASFESGEGCYRFMGCVLGRYANRIMGPQIMIDGEPYALECNECRQGIPVLLHGGVEGFDRHVWNAETLCEETRCGVRFTRLSPDEEAGFPGNLQCSVTYWWTDDNVCDIIYEAVTDRTTVVNLSNHTYFNMKGSQAGYVMEHILMVDADSCIFNSRQFVPEHILAVEGSPLDFRVPKRMDSMLEKEYGQKVMVGSWIVNDWDGTLRKIADMYDPYGGRGVEIWSTEPNFITETGRSFDGTVVGKYGLIEKFDGMILETLHMADSPNQSRFPSTILRPGEKYHSETQYRFYVR